MNDDKKSKAYEVHRLSGAMRDIHRSYGLWIIGGLRGSVSSPGCYETCPERYFEFYSLSHMYDGKGTLWLPERGEIAMEPGDCVLIAPGEVHRYGGSRNARYIEDAIKFAGPVADMLYRSGVLAGGLGRMGRVRKLLPIIEAAQDPSSASQIGANIALQKLLFELYETRHAEKKESSLDKLLRLLKENPQKWYQVSDLSEMCDMSDDQLRRLFVEQTHMRPKEYMEHLKMGQAAELLLGGRETVREIAERFGYVDPFHFSRRFKVAMGMSPAAYREAFGEHR